MPVSLGETTITRATCSSMIRAISHALPVTSNTTRSSVVRLCAKSSSTSGRVVIRPADRTLPSSAIATSQKSRCTSSPIDLTFDPFVDDTDDSGELWANDTDGSALAAQPGQSQGAATDLSGSDAHRRKRPAHVAFSRRPLEPSTRTVIRDPDGALGRIFMPRYGSVATDPLGPPHSLQTLWGCRPRVAGGCWSTP